MASKTVRHFGAVTPLMLLDSRTGVSVDLRSREMTMGGPRLTTRSRLLSNELFIQLLPERSDRAA